jgi:hypothetical protein
MITPDNRNAGKGDLRGFTYPLEPLARRIQWQLDALNAELAKVQHQLASVRAEQAATEDLYQQACEKLGRQLQVRVDSSMHQAGLLYLGQLQALLKKLQEQQRALDKTRVQVLQMCRAAEARLEGLRSHESGVVDIYLREQSRLHAAEADRDWIIRQALNRATVKPPVEPGATA